MKKAKESKFRLRAGSAAANASIKKKIPQIRNTTFDI